MDNLKPVEQLKPFTKFCCSIGAIPTSYLVAMSYEEQLLWLCDYLKNTLIPTVNNNGEAVTELQNLYIQLKNYVDNYFENLDVQEEINNKLDEMAESGQLEEIITAFLNTNALLCFDSVSAMKQANYLEANSFVKTYGTSSVNDNKGTFYKIRLKQLGETIDEVNTIALYDNTLVAEKIFEKSTFLMQNRRFVCIGDSYNITNTSDPSETVQGWGTYLGSYMNLATNDFYNFGRSGAGWAKTGNQFITLLQDNESSIMNKNTITDILVLGGVNDSEMTNSDVFTAIGNFATYCATNYPNAIITIGMLSWARGDTLRNKLIGLLQYYNAKANVQNIRVIPRLFQAIHNYNYQLEDGHPNNNGNQNIATCVYNWLKNGEMDMNFRISPNLYATNNEIGATNNLQIGTQEQILNKYYVILKLSINDITNMSGVEMKTGTNYKIAEINDGLIKANNLYIHQGTGWCHDTNGNHNFSYSLLLNGKDLKMRITSYDSGGASTYYPTMLGLGKLPPIIIPLELC